MPGADRALRGHPRCPRTLPGSRWVSPRIQTAGSGFCLFAGGADGLLETLGVGGWTAMGAWGFGPRRARNDTKGTKEVTHARSKQGYSFKQLSYDTIGACIDVQRQLGVHCMEVDYQRALELALPRRGLEVQREVEIPIAYDGVVVTRRRVDFVIWNEEGELLLETKARSEILAEDVEQCLLYLHQGGYRLCLLVNFGETPLGVRRFVHTPQGQDEAA